MQIYVKLQGGLGNQLFIYSYARMLQKYYKADRIILDTSYYINYQIRGLEIDKFHLNDSVVFASKYRKKLFFDSSSFLYHVCQKAYFSIFHRYLEKPFQFLSKFGLFYAYMEGFKLPRLKNKKNIYVYGYFQNLNNFDVIRDIIQDELRVKKQFLRSAEYWKFDEMINSTADPVAVSIRCGADYKKCKLNFCDKSYYQTSLEKYIPKGSTIYVFSDDIEEAKEYLKELNLFNTVYIPQFSPIEQLTLMRKCRYFILSNSSFSWWGAYLSKYAQKEIIFPDKWFSYYSAKDLNLLFSNYHIHRLKGKNT